MLNGEKAWKFACFQEYNACYVELSPLCQKSGQLYKEGVSISKITAFVWKRL